MEETEIFIKNYQTSKKQQNNLKCPVFLKQIQITQVFRYSVFLENWAGYIFTSCI